MPGAGSRRPRCARASTRCRRVERDLLSLVGLVSRWIPPTFYHHRFLRPKAAAQAVPRRPALVRRARAAAGRVDAAGRRRSRAGRRAGSRPTCWSSGAGGPGSLAALDAAERGDRVVLVEAERDLGWLALARPVSRRNSLGARRADARASGVELLTGVPPIGWYDGRRHRDRRRTPTSRSRRGRVVAATGSYDRVPLVPGADRPGVMAARTVIGAVERYGVVPGRARPARRRRARSWARPASGGRHGAADARRSGPTPTRRSSRSRRPAPGDRRDDADSVDGAHVHRRRPRRVRRSEPEPRPRPRCGRAVRSTRSRRHARAPVPRRRPVADARSDAAAHAVVRVSAGRALRDATPARGRPRRACRARSPAARWSASARTSAPARSAPSRPPATPTPSSSSDGPGALTGPCQGKYCLQAFACLAGVGRRRTGRAADRAAAAPPDPPRRPRRAPTDDGPVSRPARHDRAARPRSPADARRTSSSSGPGSAGWRSLESSRRAACATSSSSIAAIPGGGATGRNVARIRAMQLTEELTHVARACQAKYDRMGEELGFNVLFYRLGYAWVLYEADEVERMRAIVEMHHRIGVAQPAPVARRHPPPTADPARRRAGRRGRPQRRRDRPPRRGRLGAPRAPGGHVASGSSRTSRSRGSSRGDGGVEAVETDRGRIADARRPQRGRRLVDRAQRAGRRLGPEPTAPAGGARHGAAPALHRGRRHVLPARTKAGSTRPCAARSSWASSTRRSRAA